MSIDIDGLHTTLARARALGTRAYMGGRCEYPHMDEQIARVLDYIRAYVRKSQTCNAPKLRRISRELGISSSQVARYLTVLIEQRVLVGETADFQLREVAEAAKRAVMGEK